MRLSLSANLRLLLSALLGGLVPLSLSPVDIWPLGIFSISGLYGLLNNSSPRQAAQLGWCYGAGLFGVGVSWIFVSINTYGNASSIEAGLIVAVFVAALALLFSAQCWVFQKYFNQYYSVLGFTAVWIIFEWFRAWFLTGFPWLYLGYAHLNSPLAGFAPVFGVLTLSFIVVLTGCSLTCLVIEFIRNKNLSKAQVSLVAVLFAIWGIAQPLKSVNWVKISTVPTLTVGLVQANIDQNEKFDRAYRQQHLNLYEELSEPLWETDIVIWPETAIPLLYQDAEPVLAYFSEIAKRNKSNLISGIPFRENGKTFNSITSLGNGEGVYHKQKMVPFGEFIPFPNLLEGVFQLFKLPMSSLSRGPANQSPLIAQGSIIASFICYEVVFPDFVRRHAINADFLVTISNDTWFGGSFQPWQHLQMSAMRALENGRYMIRATSNGVSAIINEKGQIISHTEQFIATTLKGEVEIMTGRTPFSYWGSYPILLISVIILFVSRLKRKAN